MGYSHSGIGAISANSINTENSTTTPLAASATFVGSSWEDVIAYNMIEVSIHSDTATDGTLRIETSTDGGITSSYVEYIITDATFFYPITFRRVEAFVRVTYINGTTTQVGGTFSLQTTFSTNGTLGISYTVDSYMDGNTPLTGVRAVTAGKNPSNEFVNDRKSGFEPLNSTITPLASMEEFVGSWVETDGYLGITTSATGEVSEQTGWISIEFSHDATSPATGLGIRSHILDLVAASPRTVGVVAKYFRVKYENNGIAQTTFSLQTFMQTAHIDLTATTNQILTGNEDVRLVRSVSDYNTERNVGRLAYEKSGRIYGTNETVGTVEETIWPYSTKWIPNQIKNQKLRVKAGGNTNDTAAGSGARTVEVVFLDENLNEVTETLTLAGTGVSTLTVANCFRLNEAQVLTTGTYHGNNTGVITFELTGGAIMGVVDVGQGLLKSAIFTVPAGKEVYITSIYASVGQGNSADLKLYQYCEADIVTSPFGSHKEEWSLSDFEGASTFPLTTFLRVDEKSDIFFTGKRVSGGGSALVTTGCDFFVLDIPPT